MLSFSNFFANIAFALGLYTSAKFLKLEKNSYLCTIINEICQV